MYKIIVYLKADYTESDEFECPKKVTKEQITKIVNELYEEWHYYDIW